MKFPYLVNFDPTWRHGAALSTSDRWHRMCMVCSQQASGGFLWSLPLFSLWRPPQAHARPTAVFLDKINSSFHSGLSSVEQDHSGGHLHSGEEISGEFVITCGDGTEVFELIEEPFDKVTFAVEREIARSRGLAVGLGRDDWSDSSLGEGVDE